MDSDECLSVISEHAAADTEDEDFNEQCDGLEEVLESENDISLEDEEKEKYMPSTSLGPDELGNLIVSTIEEVSTFLQVTPSMAKTLLQKYEWNQDIALEKFFEGGAHTVLDKIQNNFQHAANQASDEEGLCQVCYCDGILTALLCGHLFCEDCLKEYIAVKIASDNALQIQCLSTDCKVEICEDQVASYVEQCAPNVRSTFTKLRNDNFMASNKYLQWCPGVDCGKALKVTSFERKPVKCSSCSTEFCFGCTKTWHAPVDCEHLKLWEKRCNDDSETCNWMNANTRECPKCGVAIEKNGGCNFMYCKNASCKVYFCWSCMKMLPLSHMIHFCSRYESKEKDEEAAKTSLRRYLHHYNRYMNHRRSLKLESQLYKKIGDKVHEIQTGVNNNGEEYKGQAPCWVELQFLNKAVDVLGECRRTLMYSYAFAFYLEKNNHSFIFEDNQQDLENATEHLSKALEQDLFDDEQNFTDVKRTIREKTSYVAKRRVVLLGHVNDLPDDVFESEVKSKEISEEPEISGDIAFIKRPTTSKSENVSEILFY